MRYNSPRISKLVGALLPALLLAFAGGGWPWFDLVVEGLQMGRQGCVTFSDLLLIDLIEIPLLLQNEQQLLTPVAFQATGNFPRVACIRGSARSASLYGPALH